MLGVSSVAAQRPPTIAAAANLNFALTEIAKQFERDRGARVEVVFGASGMLTRQIRDGAPFEMFLAADEEFPSQLTAAGLTRDAGAVYAVGRLVLFAPNGSPLTVDERLDGLSRLMQTGSVTRFAIANPDVAPYGRAAEATLRKHGLWAVSFSGMPLSIDRTFCCLMEILRTDKPTFERSEQQYTCPDGERQARENVNPERWLKPQLKPKSKGKRWECYNRH